MNTITAVSFLYNEGEVIERAMSALKDHVDEFVVVDLESTDDTADIARQFTDNVFIVPWLMCGDGYKMFLRDKAKSDWLLWFYGDEVFPERTASAMKTVIGTGDYTAFSFMRHEYMDDVRLKISESVAHGTPASPNYQSRLHKKCDEIFYTGLVHAEIHGPHRSCPLPPELFMEHRKTSKDQDFDNHRLYIWYKYSIWKYGDTKVEPYREYVSSYRQIVHDSEVKNLSGERGISMAEEFWWEWEKHVDEPRITLEQFKEKTGIEYPDFLARANDGEKHMFTLQADVVDRAILEGGQTCG